MSEEASAIDVYYDMDIAQICQHFNKSRNTVDKAIAKLVKDNPDKDWKYKNPITRRITIKAEGVERLSTYFRKEKHKGDYRRKRESPSSDRTIISRKIEIRN